jgi:glycosyltransferase involved in cell wall biosynthesis
MYKYNVAIIQPCFTKYRLPLFEGIANYSKKTTVYAEMPPKSFGEICSDEHNPRLELVEVSWLNVGKLKLVNFFKIFSIIKQSDIIVHFADFKYLSLWVCVFICFFTKKRCFLHGQGGYKQSGLLHKIVYSVFVNFSDGYICYTDYSRDHLLKTVGNKLSNKLTVVPNSLYLPKIKNSERCEKKELLYLGRLRNGCGIEFLLDAVLDLNIIINIIGVSDSNYENLLVEKYPNVKFHGSIYDFERQLNISKSCFAGVYGGDAGLSVVHYMALGLPVIVHSNIKMHMGPEPSYIIDGINGVLFERGNIYDLKDKISYLFKNPDLCSILSENAINKFHELNSPTMDYKFSEILGLI